MLKTIQQILEAAGAAEEKHAQHYKHFARGEFFEDAWNLRRIEGFRRFLGASTDRTSARPGEDFFEIFLGYGKDGAQALLDAYEETPAPDGRFRSEEVRILKDIANRGAGFLLGEGVPGVDGYVPRAKVSAYVSKELAEKLRTAAFERRVSQSVVIQDALQKELQP
jgi:hypothetical protein